MRGYCRSSSSISPWVSADQRQVARRAAARIGRIRMIRQRGERPEPALRQVAHHRVGDERGRPRPGDAEFRAASPVEGERVDLDGMRERQRGIAAAERHRLGRAREVRGAVGPSEAAREATQIVEADLRHRKLRQLGGGLRIEIAQEPVTQSIVGQRAQLLLDGLERTAGRNAARQRVVEIEHVRIERALIESPRIESTRIEPQRVKAGEPAHRAGEVEPRGDLLAAMLLAAKFFTAKFLASMSLDIQQHGVPLTAATAMPAAPVRNRERQTGQQHVVDARMEGGRNAGQQRCRHLGRQRERELLRGAGEIARAIERAVEQRQRRRIPHPGPERQLCHSLRRLGILLQLMRPAPERRAARRQRGRLAMSDRLPGGLEVGQQDAPRHPVDRQMMDDQQQPAGILSSGIEPHRLQHRPTGWRKPPGRLLRLTGDHGLAGRRIEPADIHPVQASRSRHRAGRRHREPPGRRRGCRER